MDSTEDGQGAKRKYSIVIGQSAGFGAGIVVAFLFGTNAGTTAISGMVLGAAAGFLIRTEYSLWARAGVALISILAVTYRWWLM